MQGTATAIGTESPRMKGAIDTEQEIQELREANTAPGVSWLNLNLMDNEAEPCRRKISISRDHPEPAEEPSLGML